MADDSSSKNFKKALANLERSLASPISEPRDLSGILKDFEMSYELSWKVLKKRLLAQGHSTQGARDVYSKAYQLGLISNQELWLEMIEDRNQTAHVYDEAAATKIYERIKSKYLQLFQSISTV